MDNPTIDSWLNFSGKVIVVTGATGVLLRPAALALARRGAALALASRSAERGQALAAEINAKGGQAKAFVADLTEASAVRGLREQVLSAYGHVDALINGAGGNTPAASTSAERPFFELDEQAVRQVFELNFMSAFFCSQAFGQAMAGQGRGDILNIASLNALRPLTRVPAYSAAKAALANFTQWLAVDLARNYGPGLRVNALAPGFFLSDQNRFLLVDETGDTTPRGQAILEHTPQGRFGEPEDLVGPLLWLISPAAAFVTGVVLPVDGGFSAYSGV